ncbi:phosphatidylinositide phosphatase SAC2 isoform X1 [Neodiprion pinetum]|uniref:Phosphatidylinositide phosphatase SAC2 isoform X1 n=1 Tax=Neodiprion lecontei TaxID=441921 RepID=A0ABM3FWZ4_NEOLC|nr:phosphatidylinositide phosphatase SAC2 isoform X1 [Neodiprion pinetum]XP_046592538.1 phosphatidylinositide phosphatase SAC2 isoform X1 [Neodiprion lecontei]
MELFRTDTHFIFVKEQHSLWCDKLTGEFTARSDWEWATAVDPECLGTFYGVMGKIEQASVLDSRIMLIKEVEPVGELHGGHVVFKIKSVAFLPLGIDSTDIGLLPCKKHQNLPRKKGQGGLFDIPQKASFAKTWGSIKSATNTIKNTTQQAAALATSQVKSTVIKRSSSKEREKFEKRILDELSKIFMETDSFFFCRTGDITNTLQRQSAQRELGKGSCDRSKPLWQRVDDRFFWNKHMLQDIINLNSEKADCWILPIIQGYVQIEQCKVEIGYDCQQQFEIFNLAIISRRSRFRAGTRYKRRGVDDEGKCANYVETEQMVWYHDHQVSFVQVRGSVPVFWSQPGYKYRPPPRIDKGEAETQVAFEKHFKDELSLYGPICVINLVEQTGKEKIIWEAYSNHLLMFDHPDLTYATFDFHEYCRGMHFENVSILIGSLANIISEMGYCWRDKQGTICTQTGTFRVNCIDCLDRTNVVQTALGKAVMEMQFTKLGLIPPEGTLPANIRQTFQLLWANNGDIISKQYAGTNALKGDYTRTGERKFTGLMKDGMNSANRYFQQHFKDDLRQAAIDILLGYPILIDELKRDWSDYLDIIDNCSRELIPIQPPPIELIIANWPEFLYANAMYHLGRYYLNRFKDVYRQATIDMMLGNAVSEEIFQERNDEEDNAATADHVKLLIEDCKKLLIPDPEFILGSWGLIDADPVTGDPTETDMDTILILTRDSYYVADYDDQIDKVTNYQRVSLADITQVEFGQPENTVSLFKNKQHHCVRISYKVNGEVGFFHMFRSTNLRFFNNMAVVIKTEEETVESLRAICEAISVAMEIAELPNIPVAMNVMLDRRRSKLVHSKGSTGLLDISSLPELTRNVSETQLLALKSAGTKALSNMTEQFSKLNKLSHSFNAKRPIDIAKSLERKLDGSSSKPIFTVGNRDIEGNSNSKSINSNSSSEDDANAEVSPDQIQSKNRDQSFVRDQRLPEAYMPTVGIVMGVKNEEKSGHGKKQANESLGRNVHSASYLEENPDVEPIVDRLNLISTSKSGASTLSPSPQKTAANTPEITIQGVGEGCIEDKEKVTPPNTLNLSKNISHSSGEVDHNAMRQNSPANTLFNDETHSRMQDKKRANSEQDLTLNITSSQSESALKSIRSNIVNIANVTSPVAVSAKDILSPFSKFAKGVQNLGANLDPRKLKQGQAGMPRNLSDHHLEQQQRLRERWGKCKSRLIAL